MTGKEFLMQAVQKRQRVKDLEEKKREYRERLASPGSVAQNNTKVQTSSRNVQEDSIIKIVDLEKQIDDATWNYVVTVDKMINTIHKLTDARYIQLLFLRYYPDKDGHMMSMKEIQKIMHRPDGRQYTLSYLSELHTAAVNALEKIL